MSSQQRPTLELMVQSVVFEAGLRFDEKLVAHSKTSNIDSASSRSEPPSAFSQNTNPTTSVVGGFV